MPKFNFSKPWVKNQGINPHAERMPSCGYITRLYRRQLVDGEFMHRKGGIRIWRYWWFSDEKRNRGGTVCCRSGFACLPLTQIFFAIWRQKLGFGKVLWKFYQWDTYLYMWTTKSIRKTSGGNLGLIHIYWRLWTESFSITPWSICQVKNTLPLDPL